MRKILLLLVAISAVGGLVPGVQATPPQVRLFEISVVRFKERAPGEVWAERGLLRADSSFRITQESPVLTSVVIPPTALDKLLISVEAWLAYDRLGDDATANFVLLEDAFMIGFKEYYHVTVSPDAFLSVGRLINISTLGRVAEGEPLIAGFVVDEAHRWLLIRAVGPTLAAHGVAAPLADPYLTIYKGNLAQYFNDDWSTRIDAPDTAQAAALTGAFPLPEGSKDAALIVELPPGIYTARVTTDGAPGTALVEVYSLP